MIITSVCLVSVQKKLSISVPFRSENLVGNVIWGKRLTLIPKWPLFLFVFIQLLCSDGAPYRDHRYACAVMCTECINPEGA